jgi:quinol monooxygenase YgiN
MSADLITPSLTPGLVTVVAVMRAKPGKEADLRAAALALIEPTRQEKGCVQYDLHAHLTDPASIVFVENWESAEDLDRHGQAGHLVAFRALVPDLVESRSVERYRRIA